MIPTLLKVAVVSTPILLSRISPPPVRPEATRSVSPAPPPLRRPAFESLASSSGITSDQIAEMRRTLDRMERISARKGKAVEMRRLILAALEAPSRAQYDAINRQLRIKLAAFNRTNRHRDFPPAIEPAADTGRLLSGPSSAEECTTYEDGVAFTGECLTEEEIRENALWIEALYAETGADYDEAVAVCRASAPDPRECEYGTWSPSEPASPFISRSALQSPFLADEDGDASPCQIYEALASSEGLPNRPACGDEAMNAGFSFSAFGVGAANFFAKYGNLLSPAVWRAATMAGRAARVGMVVLAFNLGYKIGTFINCYYRTSPIDFFPKSYDQRLYPLVH